MSHCERDEDLFDHAGGNQQPLVRQGERAASEESEGEQSSGRSIESADSQSKSKRS